MPAEYAFLTLCIYGRQSYAIKVDNIEIEKFYRSATVDLIDNSSEFEVVAQGVFN